VLLGKSASNIDVDHNLLFLASSNGLIFVIDVDGETTLGFKIAGMLGATKTAPKYH
jgi:hypothetical protein